MLPWSFPACHNASCALAAVSARLPDEGIEPQPRQGAAAAGGCARAGGGDWGSARPGHAARGAGGGGRGVLLYRHHGVSLQKVRGPRLAQGHSAALRSSRSPWPVIPQPRQASTPGVTQSAPLGAARSAALLACCARCLMRQGTWGDLPSPPLPLCLIQVGRQQRPGADRLRLGGEPDPGVPRGPEALCPDHLGGG